MLFKAVCFRVSSRKQNRPTDEPTHYPRDFTKFYFWMGLTYKVAKLEVANLTVVV